MSDEQKSYGYLQDHYVEDHADQHRGTLTPPELACVHWLAVGYNTQMIADELGKSRETIRTQIASGRAKLDAKTHAHLVACAFRAGLID